MGVGGGLNYKVTCYLHRCHKERAARTLWLELSASSRWVGWLGQQAFWSFICPFYMWTQGGLGVVWALGLSIRSESEGG